MFSPRLYLFSPFIAVVTAASCQCGFSVNSTSDPQYQIFTDYLETDFTRGTLGGWIAQDYNITPAVARGPQGKLASQKNVVPSSSGLQLWVRSQLLDNMIPMAEVDSQRTDMLYGSFRMRAKMTNVNGTCGAMFWVTMVSSRGNCS